MQWYYLLTYCSLAICVLGLLAHFVRLVRLGNPTDYSKKMGDTSAAIKYSMTKSMSPAKKESAYLYLPTYSAGILYHLGTFLSIFLFFLILFNVPMTDFVKGVIIGFLGLCALAGLGILIKRMVKKELRGLSNPDDFISNLLVTVFQVLTALAVYNAEFLPIYLVATSALLLYLPVGKLKHTLYFFAARYHLGYFFGWRGVWPPEDVGKR